MNPTVLVRRRSSPRPIPAVRRASDLVLEARQRERAGCVLEAMERYEAAILQADKEDEKTVLAESLRRLGMMRHQRAERVKGRELCSRSYEVAAAIKNNLLAGEALNTLAAMLLREGSLDEAKEVLDRAMVVGGENRELCAKVEQNLGIIANIHGELDVAHACFARSLAEYLSLGDEHRCALAYRYLGKVSADLGRFDEAEQYFRESLDIARRAGDRRLQGLCLLNQADALVSRQHFQDARKNAESSLIIFDDLGANDLKSSVYRVLGVIYRESGRAALAEARLRRAIELAVTAGSALLEAEATRELAMVCQMAGRNEEALDLLNISHRLFRKLDARLELVNVGGKVAELEGTYLALVREWGQSIESSDSYTFGHCERVADNAVAVARAFGLDAHEQTRIRLGAYLHDLGKVQVPHEILNKPGPLTPDEYEVVQMHPVWGIEMLADVEFPWDIKPIIRWHHEKYNGAGYPDRLRGEEIPIAAQIVGIVDVYDALTTSRSYRSPVTPEQAILEMMRCRGSWSPLVFDAFMLANGETPAQRRPSGALRVVEENAP